MGNHELIKLLEKMGLVLAQHDIERDEDFFRIGPRVWRLRAGQVLVDWVRLQNRDILCAKLKDVEECMKLLK